MERVTVDLISTKEFPRVNKGYDPKEVDEFLDDICDEDKERLEAEIEQKLVEVIQACQSLSSDPFGFAEAAAARFATVRDWLNFDWRELYKTADIRVNVDVG